MRPMDAADSPYLALAHDALGGLCAERADALQARAWRDEAERDALREETACLLRVVAWRLGAGARLHEGTPLSADALRDYLANHLEHQPLSTRATGGERNPGDGETRGD